ncbi:Gfo/Idh/MocA family oxidoreductase [Kribbella sp. NPDC003505]|uniref:Gfo/Idh/MocA family protein n=1 Tax=Kribbella sp. NPDC003505 TaxID=3154448 RepID=UPI0033AE89B0
MARPGVALVGLGAIGIAAHLPALLRSSDLKLVAVADVDPDRLADPALPSGTDRVTGIGPILERDDVAGIVLATPPWVTPELAVAAASTGRAVLIEKPVAVDTQAARRYDALTPAQRSRIQVGLAYRHDPAMVELRRLIEEGRLGSPLLVRAHIYDELAVGNVVHDELIRATLQRGTPVIHEGAHVLDWLRYLLGVPGQLLDAWSLRTSSALPADNVVGARLRYGPHTVLLEFGWYTAALPTTQLTVTGELGTATLDGFTFDLTVVTSAGSMSTRYQPDRTTRCFDLQVARFAALLNGATADPDLDGGLRALRLACHIADSARQSGGPSLKAVLS